MTDIIYNEDAERASLGAVLIDPSVFDDIRDEVSRDNYYKFAHQTIFKAFESLSDKRMNIDMLTVVDELGDKLAEVGGYAYISELYQNVPTVLNAVDYARIVREDAIRRKIQDAASEMVRAVHKEQSLDDAIAQSLQALDIDTGHRTITIQDALTQAMLESQDNRKTILEGGTVGLHTGLQFFDVQTLSGLRPEKFLIVAGRPGQGKSALMMLFAKAITLNDKVPFFWSGEMSRVEIMNRMIAQQALIDSQKVTDGLLTKDEWDQYNIAYATLSEKQMMIDDTPGITVQELRNKARKLKRQGLCDVVFVDYLQLLNTSKRTNMREQEISDISRQMKEMAKELQIPVVAGVQLNREVDKREGQRPMLSDLRESGSLEQDADIVISIYPGSALTTPIDGRAHYTKNIEILKHRGGSLDTTEMMFYHHYTLFSDGTLK